MRENETNWALLCWWYQSCLQENNLYPPLCVVLSSLSTSLSLFYPASVYPSLFRYLPFFHTFANTHNTLQGRDVFDIACHSQLVSFCCLVFIIYLHHQRTHAPALSLPLFHSFLLSLPLSCSHSFPLWHTHRYPFRKLSASIFLAWILIKSGKALLVWLQEIAAKTIHITQLGNTGDPFHPSAFCSLSLSLSLPTCP